MGRSGQEPTGRPGGLEARDGSGMGAWARPGCAEIGSEREGRTGFLADPLASVLDAAK